MAPSNNNIWSYFTMVPRNSSTKGGKKVTYIVKMMDIVPRIRRKKNDMCRYVISNTLDLEVVRPMYVGNTFSTHVALHAFTSPVSRFSRDAEQNSQALTRSVLIHRRFDSSSIDIAKKKKKVSSICSDTVSI